MKVCNKWNVFNELILNSKTVLMIEELSLSGKKIKVSAIQRRQSTDFRENNKNDEVRNAIICCCFFFEKGLTLQLRLTYNLLSNTEWPLRNAYPTPSGSPVLSCESHLITFSQTGLELAMILRLAVNLKFSSSASSVIGLQKHMLHPAWNSLILPLRTKMKIRLIKGSH